MDYDYRVAFGQMGIAEKILVNSFDDNQMKLYKDFCEKREAFYIIASEIYQRKF